MAHLVGTVDLGDVGHEVEDAAGVAPFLKNVSRNSEKSKKNPNNDLNGRERSLARTLSYQLTSLMKFSFRAMPALASKMEEAGWPLRSEETISSSV